MSHSSPLPIDLKGGYRPARTRPNKSQRYPHSVAAMVIRYRQLNDASVLQI